MEFKIIKDYWYKSGIYKITNTANGKIYIGSAKRLRKRFRNHRNALRNRSHDNEHLIRAYYKYGAEQFVFEVVELTESRNLLKRERFYIDTLNVCDLNVGYNKNPIAGSTLGSIRTQESKDNMSRQHGRKVSQYDLSNNFIAEYDSIGLAEMATGFKRDGIKLAAMGRHKTHMGFIWKYEDCKSKTTSAKGYKKFKEQIISDLKARNVRAIRSISPEGVISVHISRKFASEETGVPYNSVSAILNGFKSRFSKGYIFKYEEKETTCLE